MEILAIVLGGLLAASVLYWVVVVLAVGAVFVVALWPVLVAIACIGLGAYVWTHGHDNIGAIIGVLGIAFAAYKIGTDPESKGGGGGNSSDPMSGKIRTYDSKGKHTGYQDRP